MQTHSREDAKTPCAFARLVAAELQRARELYSPIHSLHEGKSVIDEEVEEFWDEVRLKAQKYDRHKIVHELVQVAAMAQRTAEDLLGNVVEELAAPAPEVIDDARIAALLAAAPVEFCVSAEDFYARRTDRAAWARFAIAHWLSSHGLSHERIARALPGKPDRSTVTHACRRHYELMVGCANYAACYRRFETRIDSRRGAENAEKD